MENISTARALALFLMALLISLSQESATTAGSDTRVSCNSDSRARALSGDEEAAYELAHCWLKEGDGGSYRFYLRLAAELGSCVAVAEYRKLQRSDLLVVPDAIPQQIEDFYAKCRAPEQGIRDSL